MKLLLALAPLALLVAQTPNVPIDNEFVHVVIATDRPVQQPGREHEHKSNRVMIYLDSGDIRIKYATGKIEDQHWKAGDIAWSAANGMHTSQNVSASTVRIVELEMKNAPNPKAKVSKVGKAVLENDQVRVYRGNKTPASGHYVAVDPKTPAALWDKMPEGAGPFVIAEIK